MEFLLSMLIALLNIAPTAAVLSDQIKNPGCQPEVFPCVVFDEEN
jgi:hypothetical protein